MTGSAAASPRRRTTSLPPPAGVYWQAILHVRLSCSVHPQITSATIPKRELKMAVTPQIGIRPPSQLKLYVSPSIGMRAGTTEAAKLNLAVTPRIAPLSDTAKAVLNTAVTPAIGMSGAGRQNAELNMAVTPAIWHWAAPAPFVSVAGASNAAWQHDVGGNLMLIWVSSYTGEVGDITVGDKSAVKVGTWLAEPGHEYLSCFKLADPPPGEQTITPTGGSYWAGSSVCYDGVISVGDPVVTVEQGSPDDTSMSIDVSASQSDTRYVMGASYGVGGNTGFSNFNHQLRWNEQETDRVDVPLLIGDADGVDGELTFTADMGGVSRGWCAAVIPLRVGSPRPHVDLNLAVQPSMTVLPPAQLALAVTPVLGISSPQSSSLWEVGMSVTPRISVTNAANAEYTNAPVPPGMDAIIGMTGAGAGGSGASGSVGGGGGGGGARVKLRIPAALLGDVFTITKGAGGTVPNIGNPGEASRFLSGDVDVRAGGGQGGTVGVGGEGGTVTAVGISLDDAEIENGGRGGNAALRGEDTEDSGAGGGGGGYGSNTSLASGPGGQSQNGGDGGYGGIGGNGFLNGAPGVAGSKPGGGGGGGGGAVSAYDGHGAPGGDGDTEIRWVPAQT